jgi:hypothetical protein
MLADRKRSNGSSTTHHVEADPVRTHLRNLTELGWGAQAISKETGVPVSVIEKIAYTVNGVPQQSVRADNAARIIDFNPTAKRDRFDGTRRENIDATGSKRRIQALVALGFSYRMLADYTGHGPSYFKDLTEAKRISRQRAAKIIELYEHLWDKTPLPDTMAQKKSVTLAKGAALKKGWLPPMAWDDGGIDNPDYDPNARPLRWEGWHPNEP